MSLDADDEILQDFLVEAGEILELLSEQLVDLENRPEDQDLTGQVIQKVTTMVTDVEARLVNLVAMAGHVDQLTGIQHGEIEVEHKEEDLEQGVGPQVNAESEEDVASNQDDVDDLLSSLGF